MWIPTLAGIAQLTPIRVVNNYTNVAGTVGNIEYTVPDGRMAVITMLAIAQTGGTGYSQFGFEFLPATGGVAGPIIEEVPAAVRRPVRAEGWVVLAEGDRIQSVVRGGDATSDFVTYLAGFECDYVDVT